MVMEMCYASSAKAYRQQMAGSVEAAQLPSPRESLGATQWENAAKKFSEIRTAIDQAMKEAAAAHRGAAAESAHRAVQEIQPHLQNFETSSNAVARAVGEQAAAQHRAFTSLPGPGETLANGREVQMDPPQKGWVEDWGLDSNPITGWMSDYEERQQDYVATNEKADQAMTAYRNETQAAMAGLPQFEAPAAAPAPGGQDAASAYSANSTPSTSGGSLSAGGGAPAGTHSSWAGTIPTGSGGGAVAPGTAGPAPAGSGSAWLGATPPITRGPDGGQWRQNPRTGAWERIGAKGMPISAGQGGSAAGGRGAAGAAGRVGGSAGGLGRGAAAEPGAGGRSGVGGAARGAGATAAGAAGSAGGRGGAPMGGGAPGARGQQGGEDEEHTRPSWLLEHDDVFTNDLDRVAPPVFGDWENEER